MFGKGLLEEPGNNREKSRRLEVTNNAGKGWTKYVSEQSEQFAALFCRLADQLTQLFDAKLNLFRVELKEQLSGYARGVITMVAGAVIAIIGFALLNVAIAFLISMLFEGANWSQPARYTVGFVITSLIYFAIGGVLIIRAKNQLTKQNIVPPRTTMELERDKEWLKKQV
jgi:uncharacterized membrane protein YqjE